eukprot:1147577-Pelagomonas_calceolata.AAC.5
MFCSPAHSGLLPEYAWETMGKINVKGKVGNGGIGLKDLFAVLLVIPGGILGKAMVQPTGYWGIHCHYLGSLE